MTRGPGLVAFGLAPPVLAPVTTMGVTPAAPDGARGWYVSAPRVTVTATDGTGTGVAETRCVLDPVGVPATFDALPAGCAYTGAGAEITTDGEHRFYAASVDAAGNREPVRSVTIRLDRTPPTVVCHTPPPTLPYAAELTPRVLATVFDDISGPWPVSAISTVVDITSFGEHIASLTGRDTAGWLTTVPCPYTVGIRAFGDDDGDGMSNEDEISYGLDPRDRFGDNGADGDPDHDGIPNLQEVSARPPSHPRGFYKQFLAEGAVGAFFQTTLGLLNASTDTPAHVLVTWLPEHSFSGGAVSRTVTLEPLQRRSFDLGVELSAAMSGGVSTTIESDQPMGAMRDMRWGDPIYGSTLERATPAPSRTWYFAEGATGAFNEYLLLANPTRDLANVQIEYLRPAGAPILQEVRVNGLSRLTVPVNEVPGLAATEVSAVVTSSIPIVAERATYVSFSDRLFDAGTAGLGATSLSSTWHFAEGATGFFNTFLLLANPGDRSPVQRAGREPAGRRGRGRPADSGSGALPVGDRPLRRRRRRRAGHADPIAPPRRHRDPRPHRTRAPPLGEGHGRLDSTGRGTVVGERTRGSGGVPGRPARTLGALVEHGIALWRAGPISDLTGRSSPRSLEP